MTTDPGPDRYAAPAERVLPRVPSTVDLHTHTTRSDGVLSPEELVRAAAAAGVRCLAISDHDTIAGYRQLARGPSTANVSLVHGVELVSAVEINSIAEGIPDLWEGELHVLGYGVDPLDEEFEATLGRQRERRRVRFDATVARLRQLGLPVDREVTEVVTTSEDALGRPTIARCLVRAGHASSVDDAFRRIIGRGQPAYVPRTGLGPVESIDAIHSAGGFAVLAHFREAPIRTSLVAELRDRGLAGLEVYYRSFDEPTVAAVLEVARGLALVPTGGSDYHGDTGTYAELHATLSVPADVGSTVLSLIGAAPRLP